MKIIEMEKWRKNRTESTSEQITVVDFGHSTDEQLIPYLSHTFILGLTHKETNQTTVLLSTGTSIKDIVLALEHFFREAEDNSWTIPALMAYYSGCLFNEYSINILESIEETDIVSIFDRCDYWTEKYKNN